MTADCSATEVNSVVRALTIGRPMRTRSKPLTERWPAATPPTRPLALELDVDIMSDPHREDDDGNNWTPLS
jgi:hypothetical protein